MDWLISAGMVLLVIVGVGFTVDLLFQFWNKVVRGRFKVPEEVGSVELCEVANDILERKRKVEIGSWLTREEFARVDEEIKRRHER